MAVQTNHIYGMPTIGSADAILNLTEFIRFNFPDLDCDPP